MYTFIKLISRKDVFLNQLPLLMLSMFISELFYKLHSFTLECVAFLVTWFILDAIEKYVRILLRRFTLKNEGGEL